MYIVGALRYDLSRNPLASSVPEACSGLFCERERERSLRPRAGCVGFVGKPLSASLAGPAGGVVCARLGSTTGCNGLGVLAWSLPTLGVMPVSRGEALADIQSGKCASSTSSSTNYSPVSWSGTFSSSPSDNETTHDSLEVSAELVSGLLLTACSVSVPSWLNSLPFAPASIRGSGSGSMACSLTRSCSAALS
ncbi:hypothetical protein MRX96_030484 [Rhipicephalus microplus]